MSDDSETIAVITAGELEDIRSVRGVLTKKLDIDIDVLSEQINAFVRKLGTIIGQVPSELGEFQLTEVEVSAEVTNNLQVVLWGVGGEAGSAGALKFLFKKGAHSFSGSTSEQEVES